MRSLDGLSQRERRLLAAIEHELSIVRPGTLAVEVAPLIRELLDVEVVARFVPDVQASGVALDRVDASGGTVRRFLPELEAGLRAGEYSFAFTMRVPEVAQRDRPVAIGGIRSVATNRSLGLSRLAWEAIQVPIEKLTALQARHGLDDHHHLRTLVCEGALVVGYFSVSQARPLDPRQHRLYRALLVPIRRRALLEHRLVRGAAQVAALEATLEALPGAAFIVDRAGRVAHANRVGRALLDGDPDLSRRLADAIAGGDHGFSARPIACAGAPDEFLVTARRATLVDAARALAAELGLGDRATEVLALVAAAEPTKLIAVRLGIAENTVEYHLTSLFRRLGVSSRAEIQRLLADRLVG